MKKSKKVVWILVFLFLCTLATGCFLFYFQKMPLVSVVLPTYNRATLLSRAIESILAQDYPNFELIIVDDGSTDNSPQIIAQYVKKSSKIRTFRNPQNKGISFSRNVGNKMALGKYIAVMDSDDISMPHRLRTEVQYLEKHPDIVGVSSSMTNLKTGKDIFKPHLNPFFLFDNTFGHPQTMVRKSFLDEHAIEYDETYIASVDYDFWAKVFMAGGRLSVLTSEQLVSYRGHGENPPAYYKEQSENRKKVSKRLFEFYNFPEDFFNPETGYPLGFDKLSQPQKCFIFVRVLFKNHENLLFRENDLIKSRNHFCKIQDEGL